MNLIQPRVGIQQRVLPPYRVPFFDTLAQYCPRGLSLFAGPPRPHEALGDVISPRCAQFFPARNVHLLRGPLYLCWQSGIIQWLETWQPEVLILEANPRYIRQQAAISWMHARRRPVIGWGLGAPPKNSLSNLARRRLIGQMDALVTYSQQGALEYKSLGVSSEKIFTAPNAVTPRPTHQPPQRPDQFSGQGPVVLFVGRLQERKRIDNLLRACAALPPASQPRVWVVGAGPARPALEALAQQVYPRAEFFGACYGQPLEDLFRSADLFVLPGTGGLAVQQAMSFALPVIVAEADGTQADLVRPQNGWQVTPGSLEHLTTALAAALEDPLRLRRMGQESYRIVAEEINLENMVEVFSHAIEYVTSHHPGDKTA